MPKQTSVLDTTLSRPKLDPPDAVIFDLDGTLWDTCDACAAGWNIVRERHGIAFREITADDVRSVAGKPHEACIREIFVGLPEHQLRILSDETAEEDNRLIAERGGVLYDGVAQGLTELAARYPLFIVSNCQAGYIELFLAFTGFGALFRDYESWGNTGSSKAENLRSLIARNRLSTPLYVGDTQGDQAAAAANGVTFAFASYGFGECSGSEFEVSSFAVLCDLLTD